MIRLFSLILAWFCAGAALIAQQQELRILSALPQGETAGSDQSQMIVVMFNRPMVALERLPEGAGSGPMLIEPKLAGSYRWLGTSTLAFTPSDPLPFGTGYTVTVPAGIKALDGAALKAAYRWKFETPRPLLFSSYPRENGVYIDLKPLILLRFNQPMDVERARPFIAVAPQQNPQAEIRHRLRHPTKEELRRQMEFADSSTVLAVELVEPLKIQTSYVVLVRASIPGAQGLLGMLSDSEIHFRTFNEFSFHGIMNFGKIPPDRALELRFSNPVNFDSLRRHVHFQPAISMERLEGWDGYESDDLRLWLPLKPNTVYTLNIDGGLQDRFGNRLSEPVLLDFTTGDYEPQIDMATGEGVLEGYLPHTFPLTLRNSGEISLEMTAITRENVIPLLSRNSLFYEDNENVPGGPAFTTVLRPKLKPNVLTTLPLNLDTVLGKNLGPVFITVRGRRGPRDERSTFKAFVQVTNLGLTGKFSPENTLIWATRLRDAAPVEGARVELRDDSNHVLWHGTTDAAGLAAAPGWGALGLTQRHEWERPRLWAFVSAGEDFALTRSEEGAGIEPWRFNISYEWAPRYQKLQGILFTDRGLYREGEEVQIKGILRRRAGDDWSVAAGQRVVVRVLDSRGAVVNTDSMALSEFGSFVNTVTLKPDAPLGYYTVDVLIRSRTSGAGAASEDAEEEGSAAMKGYEQVASGSFRVEAFRAAEFEVTVRTDRENYFIGDSLHGTIAARYLFGTPLRNETVQWRTRIMPAYYIPPGREEYAFGANSVLWDEETNTAGQNILLTKSDTVLGGEGTLPVVVPLRQDQMAGATSVVLEADVTSQSRRVISGRVSVTVHPEWYVGIKRSTTFLSAGKPLRYSLITVTPEGQSLTGDSLTVSIVRRQWNSVLQAGSGGRYGWVTEKTDSVLEQRTVVMTDSIMTGEYVPERAGLYFVMADGHDRRGNRVHSDGYFYATGSGYVAWARSDDDRIELVADKKSYAPGSTARILVQSPYEQARALVTLERDGIIRQWTTVLEGSTPEISLPITREYLPNIYCSVILLQGQKGKASAEKNSSAGRPSFKIGYVNLPVDPGSKHLAVTVASEKEQYRPGDSVTVNIRVRDHDGNGKRSEVAISVADAGVLNLINYALPDPFDFFYGPRPLAVNTSETIAHLVQQRSYGEKAEDAGGGGGLGEVQMRADFKFTAYWNPSLVTDDSGRATVRFKLPGNLTQFVIMAAAQTVSSEFSAGTSSFRVSKELLLQAAAPRFARQGDAFEAGVLVTNGTGNPGHVVLHPEVSGGVTLRNAADVEFDLAPGMSREVRFSYNAISTQAAKFSFQATMGEVSDGLTITIPVKVPSRRESVALYESTTDTATQAVVIPSDVLPGLGGLEFTTASTALGGLEDAVEYLFTYPYGCLEQRMSSILPIILGKEMVDAFSLPMFREKDARAIVQQELEKVHQFATAEFGGLSMWKGGRWSSPYGTAYALYVLIEADARGYRVDDRLMKNLTEYCLNTANMDVREGMYPYSEYEWLGTRSLIAYVLALRNIPDRALIERLYTSRQKLPLYGRAFLLKTVNRSMKNTTMEQELRRDLLNHMKASSTLAHFEEPNERELAWTFSSNARTTAIILQALLETGYREQNLGRMVRWLMAERRVGRWRSTQENVYVVGALAAYFTAFESETPDFKAEISLAGKRIVTELFKGRTLETRSKEVSFGSLQRDKRLPVKMAKAGAGNLYYGIRMNYYPRRDTVKRDEGLVLLKTVTPLDSAARKGYTFAAGSVAVVELTVITPQERNFVVVDDPLPAGFEAVNLSFNTESQDLAAQLRQRGEAADEYSYWWGGFNHVERKDDRVLLFADALTAGVHTYRYLVRAVTYGAFAMPGTHAEEMYTPDVFGTTVSQQVVVK